MADDLTEQLESILKSGDLSVEGIKAQLPEATNPAAHAPKAGHESSDEIIARQVNEQAPATTEAPVAAETTPPAISTEVETETQTQTQEPLKVSVEDALFAQLRQRYPNEPITTTAARVEAAFSQVNDDPEQESVETVNELVEIENEYFELINSAAEAEKRISEMFGDGSEVTELTPEYDSAKTDAIRSRILADAAFDKLAFEANSVVQEKHPELNDPNSPAFRAVVEFNKKYPDFKKSSPIAIANIAEGFAVAYKSAVPPAPVAPISASPTRVPAPAAPVPPAAGLASTVQASHASSVAPPPGQQTTTDDASRIRSAGSIEDLAGMFFGKGLKGTVLS